MRLIFWWLGPFIARRVYRANPLWWPVWWIASRWGRGAALALLAWAGSKVARRVNRFLDRYMDDHRARCNAASSPPPSGGPTTDATSESPPRPSP